MSDLDLARLLDDSQAGEAARSRTQERWLRQQAQEDATLAGTLLDLAEDTTIVTVRTTAGRLHQGALVDVAGDFCVLRAPSGVETYLRFEAVASVRPQPGFRIPPASGDRASGRARQLAEALAEMAAERPRVAVVMHGGAEALAGELRSVGTDVVTLLLEGDGRALCYLNLHSVAEVALLGSG